MLIQWLREREASSTAAETREQFQKWWKRLQCLRLDVSYATELERVHHGVGVHCISLDPIDQEFLLTGGSEGTIGLYNLGDMGNRCKPLTVKPNAHGFSITGIQWYPHDTGMFTSSSMDHFIKVWDPNRMECVWEFNLEQSVYVHAMSPMATSHSLIATGSLDPRIRLCDIRSGSSAQMLTGHRDAVLALSWSPIHEYQLVSAGRDQSIHVWDIRRGGRGQCLHVLDPHSIRNNDVDPQREGQAHDGAVNSLHFTEDGRFLVSSGHDQRIRLWDAGVHYRNTMVDFGSHVSNQKLYNLQCALTSTAHPSSPDPPLLFHPSDDGKIYVYELTTGKRIQRLHGHFDKVNAVIWNENKMELISAGNDHEVLLWSPFRQLYEEQLAKAHQDHWRD